MMAATTNYWVTEASNRTRLAGFCQYRSKQTIVSILQNRAGLPHFPILCSIGAEECDHQVLGNELWSMRLDRMFPRPKYRRRKERANAFLMVSCHWGAR
jgi:hypothetical protein